MANIIRNEDYENEALNAEAGAKGAMEMKGQATKPEEEQVSTSGQCIRGYHGDLSVTFTGEIL